MELLPGAYSSSQNKNFVSTSNNFLKNRNWIFAVVIFALFHMNARVFLKYFKNDCGYFHMDINGSRSVTAISR